jgi:hypothetical protein
MRYQSGALERGSISTSPLAGGAGLRCQNLERTGSTNLRRQKLKFGTNDNIQAVLRFKTGWEVTRMHPESGQNSDVWSHSVWCSIKSSKNLSSLSRRRLGYFSGYCFWKLGYSQARAF